VLNGYLSVGGLRLHHTYGGSGEPVLLLHGLGSSGSMEWRFTLPGLLGSHAVYAPDLPGFGRSEKPATGYGIDFFARVVESYIDRCMAGSTPTLVGASMGGRVAIEVALRRGAQLAGLVLVNALGVVVPRARPIYSLLVVPRLGEAMVRASRQVLQHLSPATIRRLARRLGGGGEVERLLDDAYLAELRSIYQDRAYPRAYAATVRALGRPEAYAIADQLMERLAGTGLPVLLVWGARDTLLPLEGVRRAHRRLPNSRLAVIEDAGHSPQAERPEVFLRTLQEFLASRPGGINAGAS
jgi:pimeloyl-ACP methyl ester carboxylesterase